MAGVSRGVALDLPSDEVVGCMGLAGEMAEHGEEEAEAEADLPDEEPSDRVERLPVWYEIASSRRGSLGLLPSAPPWVSCWSRWWYIAD